MNRYNIIDDTLYLIGNHTKTKIPLFYKNIKKDINFTIKYIDGSMLLDIDSSGVALLDEIMCILNLSLSHLINFSVENFRIINTFSNYTEKNQYEPVVKKRTPALIFIGENAYSTINRLFHMLLLTSDIFYCAITALFNKTGIRKGSFTQQCLLLGFNAIPIVALLSFIIGLILSLQTGIQLQQLGADAFLPSLLAIALVSEISPLITAIIVAGRSGSAIASEIATMKVTEEIDALRMMALNPIKYVVVPKFHAITVVMPLLVLISIIVGIFGGLIIAVLMLSASPISYVNATIDVISVKTFLITIIKSTVFAWQIVIIGSHYGTLVQGGAEGVGIATTKSVVASIFGVIIMDAIFSFLYL